VALLIPQCAGFLGSFFTISAIPDWYSALLKPSFNPPAWVFGPAWTVLYLLMGIAFYLVWEKYERGQKSRPAFFCFFVQIVLNALWSILFFGLRSPFAAFIEILLLWIFILLNIVFFSRVSRLAAWLLAPYLGWVSFAAFLNFQLYWLNR
jgi:benzodiazapine receptor